MTATSPTAPGSATIGPTAPGPTDFVPARPTPSRSAADAGMRRLLRITDDVPRLREDELRSAFSRSILVSTLRCLLTYLLIPFGVAPLLGLSDGIAPWVGVPLGLLAVVFNVKSIRRFWRADHRWRWTYTAISATVIVMLVVLVTVDLVRLVA